MQIIIDLHPGKPDEEQIIRTLADKLLSEAGYRPLEGHHRGYDAATKLIVIDTKEKGFFFLNKYFPVVYGFMTRAERPASPKRVLDGFSGLIYENDKELLNNIYHEEYLDFQAHERRKVSEQN